MDTKHIHCMLEKISEYGKEMIEAGAGAGNVNLDDAGKIVDMVKDLACAEKDALIAKEMRKAHEDEEAEEKHFIKMLKEQYKDEYKEMKEQYGDEADRRFYDSWRHADGSFARKGTGEYRPKSYYRRRGYAEPMYHMPLDMYHDYTPEELRDLDRNTRNVMYYTPTSGNMSGGNTSGNSGNSSDGSSTRGYEEYQRGYSEGEAEGNRKGYREGYSEGQRNGRSQSGNSRYERAKRGYEETKEKHKGNTPEDKRMNMAEFEKVLNIVLDEIDDMLEDAPPEMKNMAKTKGMARLQKIS